jgi:hypothetical protein
MGRPLYRITGWSDSTENSEGGSKRILVDLIREFLGAKSTSIRDCVGRLVGPHTMQLRGKLVTSRLIREEEEKTGYVAIPSHLEIR